MAWVTSLPLINLLHLLRRAETSALNPLDGKAYHHHPVMLQVQLQSYPLEPGILTELNGLRVPAHFDCENFCNASQWDAERPGTYACPWGTFRYYLFLPSRWHACHEQEAFTRSRFPFTQPQLPLIDEEYFEHVAVYQSVLRAHGSFNAMELGARWGTWGARSIAFLRVKNPMPHRLFLVEPLRDHCLGARKVLMLNGIDATLKCTKADVTLFLEMMEGVQHLDLLHIDIQGAEGPLLSDPRVRQVMDRKVYRLIIGTHSEELYESVSETFQAWITVFSLPQGFVRCMQQVGLVTRAVSIAQFCEMYPKDPVHCLKRNGPLWGPKVLPGEEIFAQLRSRGCFHSTPQGMVANMDGSLILDNPRFVNASRAFYLNDMELRTDELLPHEVLA
eukprot:s753_g3.t1